LRRRRRNSEISDPASDSRRAWPVFLAVLLVIVLGSVAAFVGAQIVTR
jgi:hypothetical protein